MVLLNIDREALGTGELLVGGHTHVLIGDNAVQLSAWLHNGILHQDTVSDHSTLLDANAAEQHAVLHGALDDTAIGQQGIADGRAVDVAHGVVITDLGVDRALLGEQSVQVLLIDELEVLIKVALHVADMGHIAGVLQSTDVQDVDVVGQDVTLKVDQTAGGRILDQLDQGLALQNIDVQVQGNH